MKTTPTFSPTLNNTHFELNIYIRWYTKNTRSTSNYPQRLTSFRTQPAYCFPRDPHSFFLKPKVLQEAEGDRTGHPSSLYDALCLPGFLQQSKLLSPASNLVTRSHYFRNKGSWRLKALSDSLPQIFHSSRGLFAEIHGHCFLLYISLSIRLKSWAHHTEIYQPVGWSGPSFEKEESE